MRLTGEHATQRGWFYSTAHGTFWILPQGNGRWIVWHQLRNIGSYSSPEAGLDDLVGNHCFSTQPRLDTSKLGIPRDLARWNKLLPDTKVLFHPPGNGDAVR